MKIYKLPVVGTLGLFASLELIALIIALATRRLDYVFQALFAVCSTVLGLAGLIAAFSSLEQQNAAMREQARLALLDRRLTILDKAKKLESEDATVRALYSEETDFDGDFREAEFVFDPVVWLSLRGYRDFVYKGKELPSGITKHDLVKKILDEITQEMHSAL